MKTGHSLTGNARQLVSAEILLTGKESELLPAGENGGLFASEPCCGSLAV